MHYLDGLMADLVEYRARLSRVRSSLDRMRGFAVRGLTARTNYLDEGAATLSNGAQTALYALREYAGAILEIHVRARLLEREAESLIGSVRGSESRIEEVSAAIGFTGAPSWETPPPLEIPVTSALAHGLIPEFSASIHRETWAGAARSWREATDRIRSVRREWCRLQADRRSCEWAFARALRQTELGLILADAGSSPAAGALAVRQGLTPDRPKESPELQLLLSGQFAPPVAAETWERLVDSGIDVDRLISRHCVELAGLDGIPFDIQNRAGRAAINYALSSDARLADAFRRMGFSREELSIREFETDLRQLKSQLEAGGRRSSTIQLIDLGRHDGALTAGVSFGDLDTASTVGVLVSGMRSNVRQIDDAFDAFFESARIHPDAALVTWIGYRAPGIGGELFQHRAERGRYALASFLSGIRSRREGSGVDRLVVMGHSYGSNVAAEALSLLDRPADALVTIGSAGLRVGTTRADLNASEVYATHAEGDDIARIGHFVHFRTEVDGGGIYEARVDPRSLDGVTVFSSEESRGGAAVTMHNLRNPIDWGPLQWVADLDGHARDEEVGYLDPSSTTVDYLNDILTRETV